jgi:hypothetical protein
MVSLDKEGSQRKGTLGGMATGVLFLLEYPSHDAMK